ncbi:hypothetical protein VDG1235_1963 [Verrucomicrobiia bacterium DG1235]|nr:hypothetical protein VDG1235_1963 [Verrucomicrobiae bacterium DG1235]
MLVQACCIQRDIRFGRAFSFQLDRPSRYPYSAYESSKLASGGSSRRESDIT